MLNVLIIDDEPNVRLGLMKIISWEENGFNICGEGKDAEDGYDKIINLKPDIVLIDIKLPGKLGTDVIKEAREAGFGGKFIIVSGYSNFEYAKTAIKYGVKSYILKPIDEDELMELLRELKLEIENERLWKRDEKLLRYTKLKKIILDENEDVEEKIEISKEYLKYSRFQVVLISKITNYCAESKFEELIKKKLCGYENIDIFKLEGDTLLLFKDYNSTRAIKVVEELKDKLDREMNNDIFITVGIQVDNIIKVKYSYSDAKELLKNRFLLLERGIISRSDMKINNDNHIRLELNEVISRVYSYVEISDIEKLRGEFKSLEQLIIQERHLEQQIKALCIKIFLELKQKLINNYGAKEIDVINNQEIIENIYKKISLISIMDYLLENFMNISRQIGKTSSQNGIKKIINYINTNYYMDLKLETLAEIFNYNSSYLGKLFKNNVGENFNTYLDKIRIEKAKKFLAEDKAKVYEVSEKVGYKNIDYFYSKFKKYVGTSPLNYKKIYNKQ